MKVIVLNQESVSKYQNHMNSSKIPVVSIDWVRQCVLEDRFMNPEIFSIKGEERKPPRSNSNLTLKEADHFMNIVESSDRLWNYLVSSVVYFHGLEGEELEMQKKLVHLGGGVFLDMLIPNITHVVTDSYTEEDARNFNRYSNVHIVNTIWLRDCFFFRKKIPETEFLVKPSRKLPTKTPRSSGPGDFGTAGRLVQSQGVFSEIRGSAFETGGISNQRHALGEKSRYDSLIFADTYFYFDPDIKMSLMNTYKLVLKNSGLNLKSLEYTKSSEFRDKKICCVVPDGRNDLVQKIAAALGSKAHIVSNRWVDRCLDRSSVIYNVKEEGMVDLLPFPHQTPYPNLAKYSFSVSRRLPISRKSTVKGIIDAFGATLVEGESAKSDFEIVEKDQDELEIDPARKENQRTMIWLVRLISTAQLSEEDATLVEKTSKGA